MGKSKKVDQAKAEAKKARQAQKQEKVAVKRNKKENAGEENIDVIIAEFNAREASRTAVSITICPQPSPRSNFSLTLLPSGELLLFGGEFCDGQGTEIYNDVFRWNPEKNEWKHIESLNTPPPRCSHQAVCYKDKLYIFGGEYATLDQFHHYRDLWELDLKTNVWTEVKPAGEPPSARSGHRMIVWRGFLVLFGGFYEAMREVRWYNDAYVYSFQDRRWAMIPQKPNAQIPKPRSGVTLCIHSTEDTIYIYGGYSKEKVTGSFKEGKVHEDVWALLLKPALAGAAAAGGAKGGLSGLDLSKVNWQKVSRKGDFPSTRCGSAVTMYKSKALLFGGVFDEEGPRHALVSTFYNDLYAFDLDRKRWYKLGLKQKKAKLTSEEKRAGRKLKQISAAGEGDDDNDDNLSETSEVDEASDSDDSDGEQACGAQKTGGIDAVRAEKGEFFGYIDETGNVVYIDLNEEDPEEVAAGAGVVNSDGTEMVLAEDTVLTTTAGLQGLSVGQTVFGAVSQVQAAASSVAAMVVEDANTAAAEERRNQETLKNQQKYKSRGAKPTSGAGVEGEEDGAVDMAVDDSSTAGGAVTVSGAGAAVGAAAATGEPLSAIARYFAELTEPCPRINPAILIRGNTLYIYGGVTELGDTSIPLDDCWSLDLNKRDTWKKVLGGTMHNMVWKGEEGGDSDDEYSRSNASRSMAEGDSDDSDDSDGSDDSDDDSEDGDDSGGEGMDVDAAQHRKSSKHGKSGASSKSGKKASSGEKGSSGKSSSSKGGLRAEMEGLRAHLDTTNSDRTPLSGETLRQFYSRTADVWAGEVVAQWQAQQQLAAEQGNVNKNETLSEKEIKRLGFALAETRYAELLPLLARLNELEEQQAEEEGPAGRGRGGGRGVSSGGGGHSERAGSAAGGGASAGKGKSGKEDREKEKGGGKPQSQQQQQQGGKKKDSKK